MCIGDLNTVQHSTHWQVTGTFCLSLYLIFPGFQALSGSLGRSSCLADKKKSRIGIVTVFYVL